MIRKILCLLMISFVSLLLISCENVEDGVFSDSTFTEIENSLTVFTNEITWDLPFTYIHENIVHSNLDSDFNVYNYNYEQKIIIQNNPKNQVLAYYFFINDNGKILQEMVGYIQYNQEHNSFIKTNSYSKTYRLLEGKTFTDVVENFFYKKEAGSYLKSEITIAFSTINKENIKCYKNNNSSKFLIEEIEEDYNITVDMSFDSRDIYLYLFKTSSSSYQNIRTRSINLEENNLTPINLDGYILHPDNL